MLRLPRLRSERGMTVVELMVAIALASIVMATTSTVLTRAMHHSRDVQRRTDALQRGRFAIDELTRLIRSQVCPSQTTTVNPVTEATPTSITFYADFGDASGIPQRHRIWLDPSTGKLRDDITNGAGTPTAPTWPATPTRTRFIAHHISQAGTTPVFQYFAFTSTTPSTATSPLAATVPAADLPRVARVLITLRADPEGKTDGTRLRTTVQDEVFVRLADPNDSAPIPRCV